ncbi:MAG TPA: hypothetical protein VKY89_12510 [Thermoanaerobaculia bacterium]|jgi:hypothetical protein|nr:hypothetical protein [Thermoanaerobaculia bacterium]
MDVDSGQPANGAPPELTIVLWGASQVGKTTTLAAYFGRATPEWVAQADGDTRQTLRRFAQTWDALRRNQLVPGTLEPRLFSLRHRAGPRLTFRDIQGGNARNPEASGEGPLLFAADAALIFCEWPGARTADSETALKNALIELLPERPAALVITKCEAHLGEADFLRFADSPLDFAAAHPPLAPLVPLLEGASRHFRQLQIAPVTVYGWNDGRPAHSYDEFGRLVPWEINPAEVERPFDFVLTALRAAGSRGTP